MVLWGTGEPTREFLYVDDAARALVLAAEHAEASEPFNVGTGVETKIRDLAEMVAERGGLAGETGWDTSRPTASRPATSTSAGPRELIGFQAETPLEEGLAKTIESFRAGAGLPRADADQSSER